MMALASFFGAAAAQGGEVEGFDARAERIVASPTFQAAVASFERDFDRFVLDLITLTEIPAPPFRTGARANAYLPMMIEAGLHRATLDDGGNVIALWRGGAGLPFIVVEARFDTVFPAGTDVKVKRSGTRLQAPGVADNARGLAFLLAAVRAMRAANFQPSTDILFFGNVGEGGTDSLSGMRYFFSEGEWRARVQRFIALDGADNDRITNGAPGSLRFRVTFKGSGGRGGSAPGQRSPASAMSQAIANLGKLMGPKHPRVSYHVAVVPGGTSTGPKPSEATMEVELSSTSPEELKDAGAQVQRLVREAAAGENNARATGPGSISADIALIGSRPGGVTPADSPLLRQVAATMKQFDKVPVWQTGSTEANIPISLGIPAFSMATQSANRSGRVHTLEEWTDVEKAAAVKDFSLAFAILLTLFDLP
jgi:acetylornithine deacetylase/succinyl-diaminopimelate desuccinylase-like protein